MLVLRLPDSQGLAVILRRSSALLPSRRRALRDHNNKNALCFVARASGPATVGGTATTRWGAVNETVDAIDEHPRILASHSARDDTARLSLPFDLTLRFVGTRTFLCPSTSRCDLLALGPFLARRLQVAAVVGKGPSRTQKGSDLGDTMRLQDQGP
jgi:hypothetical protein